MDARRTAAAARRPGPYTRGCEAGTGARATCARRRRESRAALESRSARRRRRAAPAPGAGRSVSSSPRSRRRRARARVTDASVVGVERDHHRRALPPAARTARTSENGSVEVVRRCRRPAARQAGRSRPGSTRTRSARPSSSAYRESRTPIAATPISAVDLDQRLDLALRAGRVYRFHQPVRSLMNVSDPSGRHRGSDTDSSGPPATSVSVAGVQVAHHQPGPVPGHVRVVPLDPAQPPPVAAPAAGSRRSPGRSPATSGCDGRCAVQADDLVDDVDRAAPVRRVVLAHARRSVWPSGDTSPSAYRSPRGVAGSGVSGSATRRSADRAGTAAGPAQEANHTTPSRSPPRPAAVLVHGGAGVLPRARAARSPPRARRAGPARSARPRRAGSPTTTTSSPSTADLAQPDRLRHDHLRGDRRRPRPVRQHALLRHRPPP